MSAFTRVVIAAAMILSLAAPAVMVSVTPAAASDFCGYNDARRALPAKQMVFYAEAPKTKKAFQFVVLYQGGYAGASIAFSNCKIDTVLNIEKLKPWCLYLPADKRCKK